MEAQQAGTDTRMADAEYFDHLADAIGEHAAWHQIDWEICRTVVKRRLARKGIRREPTDAEVGREMERM